jgi:hypothetical protein
MFVSHMSIIRILEERVAKGGDYRRILEQEARPLLAHGRSMAIGRIKFDESRLNH